MYLCSPVNVLDRMYLCSGVNVLQCTYVQVLMYYNVLMFSCECTKTLLSCSGVTLTLSSLLEGKSLNQGGHKFGIALDFEG